MTIAADGKKRGPGGRWAKGQSGNPAGRAPRATEERIRDRFSAALTDDAIDHIIEQAVKDATNPRNPHRREDRDFIARYAFPRPTEHQDITLSAKPTVALEFPTSIEPPELTPGTDAADPDNPATAL